MESKPQQTKHKDVSLGHVYVMTHSFFSDVVRIGCTPDDPKEYTKALSAKTPGDYTLVFSLQCSNPCKVKKRIREHLNAQEYVKEFYQVPAEVAERLLKRETLVIPTLMT
jgi:Meiotically up-regulated gene 113